MQCAFCKKTQDAVARLISSPNDYGPVYICDECVRIWSAEARNRSGLFGRSAMFLLPQRS
jgi:ATP-dependent Clp protease ATP-binding subunit ClpX